MVNEIRNKEITIEVKDNQETIEAIKDYMKNLGFEYFEQKRKADLIHQGFKNNKYSDLWIGFYQLHQDMTKVTFMIRGNK